MREPGVSWRQEEAALRQPLEIPELTAAEAEALDTWYRTTRQVRRRHFRRDVTHCELFESDKALLVAAADFFARYNQEPQHTLSIAGSKPAIVV